MPARIFCTILAIAAALMLLTLDVVRGGWGSFFLDAVVLAVIFLLLLPFVLAKPKAKKERDKANA